MTAVSVVVPVLDAEATLDACLRALCTQAFEDDYEIIVVDNGSRDASLSIARRYAGVKLMRCSTPGPAAARNVGLRSAHHHMIAFTDSDCVPAPNWLAELAKALDVGVSGAGGRILAVQRSGVAGVVSDLSFDQERAINGTPAYAITANAMFRASSLREIDGFDERFPLAGGEDNDLGFRLTEHGHRLAYAPGALVKHHNAETIMGFLSQRFRYGFGQGRLVRKHAPKRSYDILAEWCDLCLALRDEEILPAKTEQGQGSAGRRSLLAFARVADFCGHALARLSPL